MAQMTKHERIEAALVGKAVDRPPIAFWRHWPTDDQYVESLARDALDYQRRFDFDFIKVPPSSTYCVNDYGVKSAFQGGAMGTREYLERVIKSVEDWDRIGPLDVRKGAYGEQLRCQRLILDQRDKDVPVVHTMFNPLYMARLLAGDDMFILSLRTEPKRLKNALGALTETCADFADAVIAEGADGIFLSTAAASYEVLTEAEYRAFGRASDLAVLAAAKDGWFNIMHLHGQHPIFNLVNDYPVQALNWHDRTSGTSLSQGAQGFKGAVVGGVEQYGVLNLGTPQDVEAQVHDAIKQMGGRRLIVGAGCTYPVTVPEGNLIAARRALDNYISKDHPSPRRR